jgi:hypothetical protein
MTEDSRPPTPPGSHAQIPDRDHREFYTLFRNQIVAEDVLISHRMTWLIGSQAFLFASLAAVLSKNFKASSSLDIESFKTLLAGAGLISSIAMLIGILAAMFAIETLKKQYIEAYGGKTNLPPNLPRIVGGRGAHFFGFIPPVVFPLLCIGAWIEIWCRVHVGP